MNLDEVKPRPMGDVVMIRRIRLILPPKFTRQVSGYWNRQMNIFMDTTCLNITGLCMDWSFQIQRCKKSIMIMP